MTSFGLVTPFRNPLAHRSVFMRAGMKTVKIKAVQKSGKHKSGPSQPLLPDSSVDMHA